ncbi:hypothetical protein TorRG33x02_155370 [Trema orientale]|uniref:Uncharacterized protein n=1 Tax=Trema orientale TaxID=63057 RepID=A0A2P5ESV6_TREOI|nr:hypothetical protein TorRG33x02_155370 [Trema orientale]
MLKPLLMSKETVELGGGLNNGESYEVPIGEENMGLGRRQRANEVAGEGKEVVENERERVFEVREVGSEEVLR